MNTKEPKSYASHVLPASRPPLAPNTDASSITVTEQNVSARQADYEKHQNQESQKTTTNHRKNESRLSSPRKSSTRRQNQSLCHAVTDGHLHHLNPRVCHDQLVAVKQALASGADPNARLGREWENRNVLQVACMVEGDKAEIVRELLAAGADPNWADEQGKTPLHHACMKKRLGVVEALLKNNADVNRKDKDRRTALHFACHSFCRLQVVTMLLAFGADPNVMDAHGSTPLHEACQCFPHESKYRQNDKFQCVCALLRAGADPNIPNRRGTTPLHYTCEFVEHIGIVKALLEAKVDVNTRSKDGNKRTALGIACQKGHFETVRILLGAGADPSLTDQDGKLETMLHGVCQRGDTEIVQLLLNKAPGLLHTINTSGDNPLDVASKFGQLPVVKELIRYDANILLSKCTAIEKASDRCLEYLLEQYRELILEGMVALHGILEDTAFYDHGHFLPIGRLKPALSRKFFRSLFKQTEHCARIGVLRRRNDDGELPIHVACRTDAPPIVIRSLVQADPATLHVADHSGFLPIHVACRSERSYKVIKFLVRNGGTTTLRACDNGLALPLHYLCRSSSASLKKVELFLKMYPESAREKTSKRTLPLMSACESGSPLDVIYILVRKYPELFIASSRTDE